MMIFLFYPGNFNTWDKEYTHYEDEGYEVTLSHIQYWEKHGVVIDPHSAQLSYLAVGQKLCLGWSDYQNADSWVKRVE